MGPTTPNDELRSESRQEEEVIAAASTKLEHVEVGQCMATSPKRLMFANTPKKGVPNLWSS